MQLKDAEGEWKKTKEFRKTLGKTGISKALRKYMQSDSGHAPGKPSLIRNFEKECAALGDLKKTIESRIGKTGDTKNASARDCLIQIKDAIDIKLFKDNLLKYNMNTCLKGMVGKAEEFAATPDQDTLNSIKRLLDDFNRYFPSRIGDSPDQELLEDCTEFAPVMQGATRFKLVADEVLKAINRNDTERTKHAKDEMAQVIATYKPKLMIGVN